MKSEQDFLSMLDNYGFQDAKKRFEKNLKRVRNFDKKNRFDALIWETRFANIIWERLLEVRLYKSKLVAISLCRHADKEDVSLSIFVGNVNQTVHIPLVDLVDLEVREIIQIATSKLNDSLLSAFNNKQQQVHYE